jgi:hypothetical protein
MFIRFIKLRNFGSLKWMVEKDFGYTIKSSLKNLLICIFNSRESMSNVKVCDSFCLKQITVLCFAEKVQNCNLFLIYRKNRPKFFYLTQIGLQQTHILFSKWTISECT